MKDGIGRYLALYNDRWPHNALDGYTPEAFYYGNVSALKQAA